MAEKILLILTLMGAGVVMGAGMYLTIWIFNAVGIIMGGK